jgi:hypothetical protein
MGRSPNYRSSLSVLASCAALCTLGAACSETIPEPVIASSANEPRYAQTYPARVDGEIQAFGDGQVKVKELAAKFPSYPSALEGDVDWNGVAGIFEQAGRVGRSRAYVDEIAEVEATRTFFEEEKDELTRKVGGAAHYVAKQGGCQGDEVAGAAVHALKKTVKERLEERMREANDAHRLIDGHRDGLGKKNSATLEQQVDEVTQASYLAHIALVEHKVRINRLIEEAETIKETAEALIKAEQDYQAESGRTDEEKNASVARAEAMRQAQAGMDGAVEKAKRTAGDIEQRVEASQKQYQDALTALVTSLRNKGGK